MRQLPSSRSARQARHAPDVTRRRRNATRLSLLPFGAAMAIGGLGALLLLPAVLFILAFSYYQIPGRILPNVQIGGVSVGGMTEQEAAILLHKTSNLEGRITISDGFQTWDSRPAEMGLEVDPIQSANMVYQAGHSGGTLQDAIALLRSLQGAKNYAPVVRMNEEQARNTFVAWQERSTMLPKNPTLAVKGERIVVVPGDVGYTVNVDESVRRLRADPVSVMLSGRFQLVLMPVPPPLEDISDVQAKAEAILNSTLTIRAYDPVSNEWFEWSPEKAERARWLEIANDEDGMDLRISPQAVEGYITSINSSLGSERYLEIPRSMHDFVTGMEAGRISPLQVRHHPTRHTVQPGDTLLRIAWRLGMPYWRIAQANPGLNADALTIGQELVIPSKDDLLPLPVIPNKRIVISISRQRLWTYEDGRQTGEHVISTGIDKSPTQPGVFQVQTHEFSAYASVWDLTMPHFLGIYEAWPGFMNGLHGLPTLSNGRVLWSGALGRPTSYGCIILDLKAAEALYHWAEEGVVVEIQP